MIIWRGWGILALVIWIACLAVTQLVTDGVMRQKGYYSANAWPIILGSLIAAVAIWFLGRAMNEAPRSRSRRMYGASHSVFWVPMEYWGPIAFAGGVAVAIVLKFKAA